MDERLFEKFCSTVEKYNMIAANESVVAGLSGGADSVCLLLMLLAYKERVCGGKLTLAALHYHHGIRGEEADGDERFCRELCAELGVSYYTEKGDVPAFAKENKISHEEAARILRYRCLERIAEENGAQIAVAHTANDRAETVLFHIARGTSIDGLKGIAYRRENIIRPLLDFTRSETEQVCREASISYREDSTNTDNSYTRNRIRNEVLPYLDKTLGVDFSGQLLRLSALAAEESDYMQKNTKTVYRLCVSEETNGCCRIKGSALSSFHPVIGKRVVRMALSFVRKNGAAVFPDGTGLDQNAIERIYKYITENQGGGCVQVMKSVVCTKWGKDFWIGPEEEISVKMSGEKPETSASQSINTEENRITFERVFRKKIASLHDTERLFDVENMPGESSLSSRTAGENNQILIPHSALSGTKTFSDDDGTAAFQNESAFRDGLVFPFGSGKCLVRAQLFSKDELFMAQYTCSRGEDSAVLFDFDALCAFVSQHEPGEDIVIRTRREGDVFKPLGRTGGKPLRRFFTDRKIPAAVRDFLPVLACGNEILHIFYLCRSNFAPVQKNTECGIMIRICELQQ